MPKKIIPYVAEDVKNIPSYMQITNEVVCNKQLFLLPLLLPEHRDDLAVRLLPSL